MFKEILQSKLFTGAALVITGFFLVSIIKLELPLVTVSKELKKINQKIDETEKTDLELEKLGDYLKSDTYLERQARLKLNYKKPDEKVVYVYTTEAPNGAPETQRSQELKNFFEGRAFTNLKQWFGFLIQK